MGKGTLLRFQQLWVCPNCDATDVTYRTERHLRMHPCPGLRGLSVGMVKAGTKCKTFALEREDYVGNQMVQLDPELGRPVMSVVTVRDDGQDCIVYAPTATVTATQG